jgi:hypothetical protein
VLRAIPSKRYQCFYSSVDLSKTIVSTQVKALLYVNSTQCLNVDNTKAKSPIAYQQHIMFPVRFNDHRIDISYLIRIRDK